jgi:hypothetical protein
VIGLKLLAAEARRAPLRAGVNLLRDYATWVQICALYGALLVLRRPLTLLDRAAGWATRDVLVETIAWLAEPRRN